MSTDKELIRNSRIWELDFLRGICIFLMVIDHTIFDIAHIFNKAWTLTGIEFIIKLTKLAEFYGEMPLRLFTQGIVIFTIFFISGISNSFSRSNLKRGLKLMFFALLITLATVLLSENFSALEGNEIRYGVLHMLASCILVWTIINFIFRDRYSTAAACLVVAVVAFIVNYNMTYFAGNYLPKDNLLAFLHPMLAKDPIDFSGGDYFPLLSHIGKFMLGAAIGPVIYKNRRTLLPFLDRNNWYCPVNFIGRHTLEIVVLHQPVINLLLALISALFITKGDFVLW